MQASRWSRLRDRAVKAALLRQLRESGLEPREVAEWLWEDYGIRARPRWGELERAILRSDEVTPQDLAVLLMDAGVEPDEGAWSVEPRPAPLRGARGAGEGD
ncbi:hypothetical protein [Stetteria hydrogenophila]